ncbi:MAG: hypothetical protein J6S21_04575 [Victivallales bacterium]|nr:hypothetical protein [Victivallales bacterium]
MRLSDEIRIIDLLVLREAEYLRIHECEEQIAQLLGGAAFPFPAPAVELPSAGRCSRGKSWCPEGMAPPVQAKGKAKSAPVSAEAAPAETLRPLKGPQENAYRVVYRDKDGIRSSYHLDRTPVMEMIALECETFSVESVEAVHFENTERFNIVERLYVRPDGSGAATSES